MKVLSYVRSVLRRRRTESALKNNRDDWGCLQGDIIEKILSKVKESSTWKSDARSLRLVNRNWCRQTNRLVTKAHPHHSKKLRPSDYASLNKFPNLESIDILPFLNALNTSPAQLYAGLPFQDTALTALKPSMSTAKSNFLRLIDDLSSFTNLKKLIIAPGICMDPSWASDSNFQEAISRLSSVTHLEFKQGTSVVSSCDLCLWNTLPIKRISGCFNIDDLAPDLLRFSDLQEVEVEATPSGSEIKLLTENIQSVKLTIPKCRNLIRFTQVKQLESLHIRSSEVMDGYLLPELTQLKHLKIEKDEDSNFYGLINPPSNISDLELKSLHLHCNPRENELGCLPTDFFEHVTSLEELSLIGIEFRGKPVVLRFLHRLKSLTVRSCIWVDNNKVSYRFYPWTLELDFMVKLVHLECDIGLCDTGLTFIAGLSQLETLNLRLFRITNLVDLNALRVLKKLSKLSLSCDFLLTETILMNHLDFFQTLDEISLRCRVDDAKDSELLFRFVQEIQQRAGWIKLSIEQC